MNLTEINLPQLIVALDSPNDNANYVHIKDVKDDVQYYCPCCKGLVKPRAYKNDVDYKVQAHFYHEAGGCSEESFIHYICKKWLFEKGCQFIVDDVLYEVDCIETEKTLHTKFGDYRPDIIVTTTIGKVLFFEIKHTSKKTTDYVPKWDELSNDVVEVDTRYFINQKFENNVPTFNLIYSDGECFIKSYSRQDYEDTIAKRKLEWKRQDKLNYKIQWERLDWFWTELQLYATGEKSKENVLESFSLLDYSDKLWCYQNIKKKHCVQLKNELVENINKHFFDMVRSFETDMMHITTVHISPKIYEIHFRADFHYLDYDMFEEKTAKVKVGRGGILPLDSKNEISNCVSELAILMEKANIILQKVDEIAKFQHVKRITPYSHWAANNYSLSNLNFIVEYHAHIHSEYIKENIGKETIRSTNLSKRKIKDSYKEYRMQALEKLEAERFCIALENNILFNDIIQELSVICEESKYDLSIHLSSLKDNVSLFNGFELVCEYPISRNVVFGEFENEMKDFFIQNITEEIDQLKSIEKYINIVNSCKNGLWKLNFDNGTAVRLTLYDDRTILNCRRINLFYCDDIKNKILQAMIELLEYAENYKGIRFLEVN